MNAVLGVDPGKGGAMAILAVEDAALLHVSLCPALPTDLSRWYLEVCHEYHLVRAALEKVHAMPKQGGVSMFSFGENYGIHQGLLLMAHIPFDYVRPQDWQKRVFDKPKVNPKEKSVYHAMRRYPGIDWPKAKEKREGYADAINIARYALLLFHEETGKTVQRPRLEKPGRRERLSRE